MLPLWIVDIRENSHRREHFRSLLGEIEHIYFSEVKSEVKEEGHAIDESSSNGAGNSIITIKSEIIDEMPTDDSENVQNDEEELIRARLDAFDRERADRASIIDGYWWRYSDMHSIFKGSCRRGQLLGFASTPKNGEERVKYARETAELFYEFQSLLVKEGQEFIRDLRHSNAKPDMKLNIIVLGDLEEEFTRMLFSSVAGIIQKEKGRLLANHIHQGMEIIGMLYIPSDINNYQVETRQSMQRTLKEIDVQYRVSSMRGYDHMMLYQDVQSRTECSYSALNDTQLAEYLIQCIINLYLATTEKDPLLSGTSSAEDFYFSMGATAVEFDIRNENIKSARQFGKELLDALKHEGKGERYNDNLDLFSEKEFLPETFFDYDALNRIEIDESDFDENFTPHPHPVKNFFSKYLKRNYYGRFIGDFTSRLMNAISSVIDDRTRGALETIASVTRQKFSDAKNYLYEDLKHLFTRISADDGGIPFVIRKFKRLQEQLSLRKKDLSGIIEEKYWRKIEDNYVPKRLRDNYDNYHEAYLSDIASKGEGKLQEQMKREAVDNLNGLLANETPILSRIGRGVLLGIMAALAFVPVLGYLSPEYINLGRVKRYAEWWSLGVFTIPIIFQVVSWWWRERKKRRAVDNIKTMFMHDAFARVANRIETEVSEFYSKIISLADQYIKRADKIMTDLHSCYNSPEEISPVIPYSTFCQPLMGGHFGYDGLLEKLRDNDTKFKISNIHYSLNQISLPELYIFLNQNYNFVIELFKGVDVYDSFDARIDQAGERQLITAEEQNIASLEKWKVHKERFLKDFTQVIDHSLVPSEYTTVGEMITAGIEHHTASPNLLKSMVAYSASNGEIVSSADIEYADIKTNEAHVENFITSFISTPRLKCQVDRYNVLYQKYLFLSRWRSYEKFYLNRILPMEDFDLVVKDELVIDGYKQSENSSQGYKPFISTLLLWSLATDDSSPEWFRLLDSEYFEEAYSDKEDYRLVLYQED